MKIFKCNDCPAQFDMPDETTVQAAEYPGTKAWNYTEERCPKCNSKNFDFTPEGHKAAFGELKLPIQ